MRFFLVHFALIRAVLAFSSSCMDFLVQDHAVPVLDHGQVEVMHANKYSKSINTGLRIQHQGHTYRYAQLVRHCECVLGDQCVPSQLWTKCCMYEALAKFTRTAEFLNPTGASC